MTEKNVLRLAVLISGGGRTLKNLIELTQTDDLPIDIRLVVSSATEASGIQHATDAGIPTIVCQRNTHPVGMPGHQGYSEEIFTACRKANVDYVLMAGFLKYVPIPDDFEHRVLNIHPALIPAFCGQGMYGHHVHQAVLDAGAKVTGCTVHFADNAYDHGPIIYQKSVPVETGDTADTLAARVFEAETAAYPHVLKLLAAGMIRVDGQTARIDNQ